MPFCHLLSEASQLSSLVTLCFYIDPNNTDFTRTKYNNSYTTLSIGKVLHKYLLKK